MNFNEDKQSHGPNRFVIGYIGTTCFWSNMPVYNNPPNETLLDMSDADLEKLAYSNLKDYDQIKTEKYKRPSNKAEAEAQGGIAGEEYYAPCRAKLILAFRELQKKQQTEIAI